MRSVVYSCDWCKVEHLADDRGHAPSNWEEVMGAGEGGYAALLCVDCIVARERAVTAARVARSTQSESEAQSADSPACSCFVVAGDAPRCPVHSGKRNGPIK